MSTPAEILTPEQSRETVTVELNEQDREQMSSANGMLAMARSFPIESQDDYNEGADLLKDIKQRRKELDDRRKLITKPMDDAKKRVMDLFRTPIETLDQARSALETGMGQWYREQERIRQAEEARIREEQRREEEKRRKAAERKAEAARKKGDEDRAQEILDEAEHAPPPPAPVLSGPEQPKGTHARTYYKAQVVNKKALIKAVADGQVPDAALVPDMTVLNGQARSLKTALNWPGVKVIEDTKPVTRG